MPIGRTPSSFEQPVLQRVRPPQRVVTSRIQLRENELAAVTESQGESGRCLGHDAGHVVDDTVQSPQHDWIVEERRVPDVELVARLVEFKFHTVPPDRRTRLADGGAKVMPLTVSGRTNWEGRTQP